MRAPRTCESVAWCGMYGGQLGTIAQRNRAARYAHAEFVPEVRKVYVESEPCIERGVRDAPVSCTKSGRERAAAGCAGGALP